MKKLISYGLMGVMAGVMNFGCAEFFSRGGYSNELPQIIITFNGDDYFSMDERTNHLFWALIRRVEDSENRRLSRRELSNILKSLDLMDEENDGSVKRKSLEEAYGNMLKNMNEENPFKKYFNAPEKNQKIELGPHIGLSPDQ